MSDTLISVLLSSGLAIGITCVSLAFTLVVFVGVGKMMKNAQGPQIANGRSAPAVVLGVQDTGMSINDNPQVQVDLQVHPPGGAPYQAKAKFFLSRVQTGTMQQGSIVHVRYDPANPATVAVVGPIGIVEAYAPPGRQAPPPLPPLLQRLVESQERTTNLKAAPEQTGTISTAEELGLFCAGRNPFMAFEVEVRPTTGPTFSTKVEGVISQLSVDRYRVGQSVIVKVDPANSQNASLERSA